MATIAKLRDDLTMLRHLILCFFVLCLGAGRLFAQDLSALAQLDAEGSYIEEARGGIALNLSLSQPVPWRARMMANPTRLVLDFREVNWQGLNNLPIMAPSVKDIRAGSFRPGWSRLVLTLSEPFIISKAQMTTENETRVTLALVSAMQDTFLAQALRPEPPEWQLPVMAAPDPAPSARKGPMVVVLDPGHGGIDPGAERDGLTEKFIVLQFALELRELLTAKGNIDVVMTRETDVFVPLEERVSIARAANADVFLSLHADAILEGEAEGVTIYRLDETAEDAASVALAERHDRDDLLAGVDLTAQDDEIAHVLMDMARTETGPRITRLSAALNQAFVEKKVEMYKKPEQGAGFSVLKSPDIPSVLVELGFMSSAKDVERLRDAAWREKTAQAILSALLAWQKDEEKLRGE